MKLSHIESPGDLSSLHSFTGKERVRFDPTTFAEFDGRSGPVWTIEIWVVGQFEN